MRILHVIHGFPPHYMAGSEVYTYNLTKEQLKRNEVYVFTRIVNPSLEPYSTYDESIAGVRVRRVNKPLKELTLTQRYHDAGTDMIFRKYVQEVGPDVVHIDHLSHLSSEIAIIAKEELSLPVVITLHDFWLLCPRGQLIKGDLRICQGPEMEDCADCLRKWTRKGDALGELGRRKEQMARVVSFVDLFIAPSRFLMGIFEEFGVPRARMVHSDYGFDKTLFQDIKRAPADHLRVGYIGTHIPSKGVQVLIEAFNALRHTTAELKIYGPRIENTGNLERLVENPRIEFMGGYPNWEIGEVLSGLDVVVVPSLWYENSPLVIHEAFLAGIPVIASNNGGMAELVRDNVDGLLFEQGSSRDLVSKFGMLIEDPGLARRLGNNAPPVKSIGEDSEYIQGLYERLVG